eukprot:scaffold89664_cov49-Phaeocystis_antarctica.AAC.2
MIVSNQRDAGRGLGLVVGLGSGLGVRAHLGPCLVRRARSAWLYTFHTLCRTYPGEDLGIGLGIGLVLGRGLGLGRRLGLGCVLELGLVGPVVVQGGADGLEEHTHLPGARDVNAVYTQSIYAVYTQGACRGVYAAHAPRRAQASLRTHGLPPRRASGPPPYRAPGVRGRVGVGWGFLASAVSSAWC